MSTAPAAVFALWWIALALTVVVIVPITLRFLQRTWFAARMIHRYAADTRVAAEGIARNLAAIAAFERARSAAAQVPDARGAGTPADRPTR